MSAIGNKRAVVIGASMAGLLAARALHESFEQVVVLDRDVLPEQPVPRRGVPQSGQVHALLARGQRELNELFDGLTAELAGLGVPAFDPQADFTWWVDGRPMAGGSSGMTALGVGRPMLETVIRRRVAALPNVEIRPAVPVADLLSTPAGEQITGVRVVNADGGTVTYDADLVVDASGRGSRARHWLAGLGYPAVEEQRVEIQVSYVSRLYHRKPGDLGGRSGTAASVHPGSDSSGMVLAQENNSWMICLSGWFGRVPPTDFDGMVTFAEELVSPDVAALIRTAVPMGEPVRMRYPASTRQRFDRMDRFPAGLLVVGDAMCSFNPVYGQGMTLAAMEATILRQLLKDGTDDVAARYFAATAPVIDVPWNTTVANDLRHPGAVGDRSALDPERGRYLAMVRATVAEDPVVARAFLRVTQLMDPPSALFAPGIAARLRP